jgi:5-methylcytosine-specific restriction enzyme B
VSIFDNKIEGAPQFASYFASLLEILLDLGGRAKPTQVYDEIASRYDIPDAIRNKVNKNGRPTYQNRIAWAYFYLVNFHPYRAIPVSP